ncbi:unnamed protein product [Rotaria sp. Silwood2]|nr:unnamed protein product [Rotaria sp. Silwood2]CAF2878854.1 unnamed protein product [Rotaria sp. Silwood2]CAF3259655.1 unnamed protein product [Rotaria sp. Silwood2]CAF4470383.1 unnamed protein product [Rotaria sp. Silwood2]CAF4478560.1 unnamed protein product [Rotaria sp. Silwood2]
MISKLFSLVSAFYIIFVSITSATNTTGSAVQISNSVFTSDLLQGYHVFRKYQETTTFELSSSSDVFVKIPGLTFATHHSQPMVYQLQFHGTCQQYSSATHSFIRFLIDNRVLISNYLLPNNDQRQALAPELGISNFYVDYRGGSMSYGALTTVAMPCPKSDLILLKGGTHIIEVAARFVTNGKLYIFGGELTVQMMQYQVGTRITIPSPIIRG